MGGLERPPNPPTFGTPRQSRGVPLHPRDVRNGPAEPWAFLYTPATFGTRRQSRGVPLHPATFGTPRQSRGRSSTPRDVRNGPAEPWAFLYTPRRSERPGSRGRSSTPRDVRNGPAEPWAFLYTSRRSERRGRAVAFLYTPATFGTARQSRGRSSNPQFLFGDEFTSWSVLGVVGRRRVLVLYRPLVGGAVSLLDAPDPPPVATAGMHARRGRGSVRWPKRRGIVIRF